MYVQQNGKKMFIHKHKHTLSNIRISQAMYIEHTLEGGPSILHIFWMKIQQDLWKNVASIKIRP